MMRTGVYEVRVVRVNTNTSGNTLKLQRLLTISNGRTISGSLEKAIRTTSLRSYQPRRTIRTSSILTSRIVSLTTFTVPMFIRTLTILYTPVLR